MELLFLLYCKSFLDFSVPDFRYYNSIALSALDATFSAQANYAGVIHVIDRFCENYGIDNGTHAVCPAEENQVSVTAIRNMLQDITPEQLADVVGNRQKVDRHIRAFATKATGHANLTDNQIKSLFRFAAEELSKDYPEMTPRHLDHIVWVYQRGH